MTKNFVVQYKTKGGIPSKVTIYANTQDEAKKKFLDTHNDCVILSISMK